MATRKVFIDDDENQIISFIQDDKQLIIDIKISENPYRITLSNEDAKEFILELYRLGKKLK